MLLNVRFLSQRHIRPIHLYLSALQPGIAPKIWEKAFFRANMYNSGILSIFHNPEIPRLKHRQSRDSGLRKWAGIRDHGIGIPSHDVT